MPTGIYIRTEKHKEALSRAGKLKTFSFSHRERISQAKLGKKRPDIANENNHNWKGEFASYRNKHKWIVNKFGKASKCENINCKYPRQTDKGILLAPKRYEWANVSNEYKRERSDWLQLCPSCHKLWDLGKIMINNIQK